MWQRRGLAILGVLGALFLLKIAFIYLAPFLIALVLALILDLPVSYLERLGLPRALGSFFVVVLAFLGIPLILSLFLVHLWYEIKSLSGIATLGQLSYLFSEKITMLVEGFPLFDRHLGSLNLTDFAEPLFRWATAIPDFLLIWLLSAISAYFFCKDKKTIAKFIIQHIPKSWRVHFFTVYHKSYKAIWHILQVQIILLIISTGLTMALFCLLRLPYSLSLGLLAGFLDLIPVVGPGMVYLALLIYYFWLGRLKLAGAIGLAYLLFILLRQVGEPRLVSDRLGLHPVTALVALYFGFKFGGILGAFLGPLVMVFLKAALAIAN